MTCRHTNVDTEGKKIKPILSSIESHPKKVGVFGVVVVVIFIVGLVVVVVVVVIT